jgi:Protein of unknown function (DUF2853)
MSKFNEAVELYMSSSNDLGLGVDESLLTAVAKGLGPSIYNTDSSKVSCSDQSEMDRVKANFLVKKLGLTDGPELDAAIKEVCDAMGSDNRNKYRALFYALLVKKFGKESMYA